MILKIRPHDPKQMWFFIDGLRTVTFSDYVEESRTAFFNRVKGSTDIFLLDHTVVLSHDSVTGEVTSCAPPEGASNYITYVEAYCTDNQGNQFTIYFDQVAYLLNDNSKTVDKILVPQSTEGHGTSKVSNNTLLGIVDRTVQVLRKMRYRFDVPSGVSFMEYHQDIVKKVMEELVNNPDIQPSVPGYIPE